MIKAPERMSTVIRMIQDNSGKVLENSLDASALRQTVIANNIANVDTPGYKRELVDFESRLKAAINMSGKLSLSRTDRAHLGFADRMTEIRGKTYLEPTGSLRMDDNNVDIDQEIAMFVENTLKYSTLTRALSDKFSKIDAAIKGRG